MARKKKHEEHENHERWLVSYADFITLLFAFFVVMYAVSSVNEGKYRVLSDSLLAAFRSPQKTLQPIQIGNPAKAPQTDNLGYRQTPNIIAAPDLPIPDIARKKLARGGAPAPMAEIAEKMEEVLSRLIDEDLISVRYEDDYVEIEIKSEILFPPGSIQVSAQAREIIDKIAIVLRNFPNIMRIEGFTDNTPLTSPFYKSNWVLSAARAGGVVERLESMGVRPSRMAAVGYGQYRPVADNATVEGRNKNRRVAIIVLNQTETAEIREELYLASTSKDGRAYPPAVANESLSWKPPSDVTNFPVTETGLFPIIEAPVALTKPVRVNISPQISHVDRVPVSVFMDARQQGEVP